MPRLVDLAHSVLFVSQVRRYCTRKDRKYPGGSERRSRDSWAMNNLQWNQSWILRYCQWSAPSSIVPLPRRFKVLPFRLWWRGLNKNLLTEPHVVIEVATRAINAPSFTVPMTKFVKQEVEKPSFEKEGMERSYNLSDKAAVDYKTKAKDELPPHSRWTRWDPRVSRRTYLMVRSPTIENAVCLRLRTSRTSAIMKMISGMRRESTSKATVIIVYHPWDA